MNKRDHPAMDSTPQRLINAALDLWSDYGWAGVSVRSICHLAEAPASSISYHFGNIEQLLTSTQSAAIKTAAAWCDAQRASILQGPPLPATAFAPLLAALIDDWCTNQRRYALAWRECQLLANRNPAFAAPTQEWRAMWHAFWRDMLAHFGLDRFCLITSQFFDGESLLHLIRWQRPVDRACLEELCAGWTAWLTLKPTGDAPWRKFAMTEAARLWIHDDSGGPVLQKIGEAAALLLGREGASAVTHRTVAREAGLTLGTVTYHCRSSTDLAQAAHDAISRKFISHQTEHESIRPSPPVAEMRKGLMEFANEHLLPEMLLALDELLSAAARDSAHHAFAATYRYDLCTITTRQLKRYEGWRHPFSDLDAALFSIWSQGLRRDILGCPIAERMEIASRSINDMFERRCG